MPLFQYQCKCGVRFEAVAKMSEHSEPQKCPECSELAPRMMPDNVNGSFHQEVNGPVPQNTGVSELDTKIDMVIGRSAEQGRKAHAARVDAKKQVLRENPDATGYDITRTTEGEFTLMSKKERDAREAAHSINNQAMGAIKQERVKVPSPEHLADR